MYGFDSFKDVLDVLLVPAVGGLVAMFWPEVDAADKRRRFERLIIRELEEAEPYPEQWASGETIADWTRHQTRTFLHQRLLRHAAGHRDFILALDPTLVYQVSQLWDARRMADHAQWEWYLKQLGLHFGGDVAKVHQRWEDFLRSAPASPRVRQSQPACCLRCGTMDCPPQVTVNVITAGPCQPCRATPPASSMPST